MTPLRARYARIDKMVDTLLAEHQVTEPPVPIGKIIRAKGITIREIDLKDLSGMLVRDKSSVLIGTNKKQAKTRQRFTLAHEFGHFLLHEGKTLHYDKLFRLDLRSAASSQGNDVEEIEANYFAASILMPKTFLERDVSDRFIDLDDAGAVESLAKSYDVSSQAMNVRLINLFGDG